MYTHKNIKIMNSYSSVVETETFRLQTRQKFRTLCYKYDDPLRQNESASKALHRPHYPTAAVASNSRPEKKQMGRRVPRSTVHPLRPQGARAGTETPTTAVVRRTIHGSGYIRPNEITRRHTKIG